MESDIQKKKRFKTWRNRIIIILLVLGIGYGVYAWDQNNKAMSKLVYDTDEISKGEISSTVSSTGSLSPVTTVDVGSQVSGTIEYIAVDYNDRVTTGQILARIDPAIYQTQLDTANARMESAKASLASAQASRDSANSGIYQAQAEVYQAQAGVSKAEAQLENARSGYLSSKANLEKGQIELANLEREYKRAEELYSRNLIALSERDSAYTQYKSAQAMLESVKADVESAKSNVKSAQYSVDSAKASLKVALIQVENARIQARAAQTKVDSAQASISEVQGDIETIKVNMDRCVIRSPIDGVVIDRKVDVGQTVAASFTTPVLFTLAKNLQQMEVKASVDEADIGKVKEGQKVKFTVDAYPEDQFEGKIQQVRSSPTESQNVVTYQVIIRTDNKELKLKPGMTANIDITVETKKDILRVPNTALRFKPEKIAGFPLGDEKEKEKPKTTGGPGAGPGAPPAGEGRTQRRAIRSAMGDNKSPKTGEETEKKKQENIATLWTLDDDNNPRKIQVATGITDSSFTEIIRVLPQEGEEDKDKKSGTGEDKSKTMTSKSASADKDQEDKPNTNNDGKNHKGEKSPKKPVIVEEGTPVITDAYTVKQQMEKEKRKKMSVTVGR